MKTKDEGTAWLRSHGWIQCDRGWTEQQEIGTVHITDEHNAALLEALLASSQEDSGPITEKQATTKQGDKA